VVGAGTSAPSTAPGWGSTVIPEELTVVDCGKF